MSKKDIESLIMKDDYLDISKISIDYNLKKVVSGDNAT